LTSSFTLSAWINPTNINGAHTVLIKEQIGSCVYYLQVVDNMLVSGLDTGNSCNIHLLVSPQIPLNTWSYVSAVFDDAANSFRLYLDGNLLATQTEPGSLLANTEPLVFGQTGCGSCGNERWQGLMDEIRIYNRALSQTEIQTDMKTPL
jgi:hypothetical protein